MGEKAGCTAIVCAYNEERTIGGVLTALLESPLVDEIIAVDDGSTDRTFLVISSFERQGVRAIRLPQNRGKGFAMAEGIAAAHGEVLAFVDADLLNLAPEHVAAFVRPVLAGDADMVIGYPKRDGGVAFPNATMALSGERALYRNDILPIVPTIRDSRFGVETIINFYYRKQGKRVRYVPLEGLVHPVKVEKTDFASAMVLYTREMSEIATAVARNYPLALAALGLDPEKPRNWVYRTVGRFSPQSVLEWPNRVSIAARQGIEPLKRAPWSAMGYLGLGDSQSGGGAYVDAQSQRSKDAGGESQ